MKFKMQYWASILFGIFCGAASAAESPATVIHFASKEYIKWDGKGAHFEICNVKNNCMTPKMPKAVTPINKLSLVSNITGARATWLVSSAENNFICSMLPNMAAVRCTKVLNAPKPIGLFGGGWATKNPLIEAKSMLEGELAMARYHSQASGESGSVTCPDCDGIIKQETEERDKCRKDARAEYKTTMQEVCLQSETSTTVSYLVVGSYTSSSKPPAGCGEGASGVLDNDLEGCKEDYEIPSDCQSTGTIL